MLFSSISYLYFLCGVLLAYWSIPNRGCGPRLRVWLLLLASIYFYASWNEWLALIVCASTLVDYLLARLIDSSPSQRQRKAWMILSLSMNLGLLAYFKYVNFFLDSLAEVLASVGASASMPVLSVIVPVGISFYTFEAINYIVDVYRRKLKAQRDPVAFMLFVLFFPHLVAGPIVRARDFLPQIARPKRWSWSRVNVGLWLLALGLFKKLAIADRMAMVADPVFTQPEVYGTLGLWMGMVAFALQVYCDFSGYSDMALGSAHLLGYKLTINFNLPFLAVNVADFWKRWHISLSVWLRDYLFIPLGGSRRGEARTRLNLLITMTLGGLWHGANWNYVLWGTLQGILLGVQRMIAGALKGTLASQLLETSLGTVARIAFTFLIFCLSLALFRTLSLSDAGLYLTHLFQEIDGRPAPLNLAAFLLTLGVVFAAHVVGAKTTWLSWSRRASPAVQAGLIVLLFVLAVILSPGDSRAFVYFQF